MKEEEEFREKGHERGEEREIERARDRKRVQYGERERMREKEITCT